MAARQRRLPTTKTAASLACLAVLYVLLIGNCETFSIPWRRAATLQHQQLQYRRQSIFRLSAATKEEDEAQALLEEAERLRQEVASFQKEKLDILQEEQRVIVEELQERQEIRNRFSAEVPICKEDGSTVVERVDFPPLYVDSESRIEACTAALPLGLILGEYNGNDEDGSDNLQLKRPGIRVDAVAEGSNGEAAGVKVGDLLRACTATQTIMDAPTWQIIAGGIGVPKTKRFMYSTDGRPFEEVMEAVASNRMDPEGRPVVLVMEKRA